MNNKLETVIAEINLGRKIDIRGFFVVGSFTESDIDIIKQKTGIELIKDFTPFFHTCIWYSEQRSKEYIDFLRIADEYTLCKTKKIKSCNSDGTMVIKTVDTPPVAIIVEPRSSRSPYAIGRWIYETFSRRCYIIDTL